MSAEALLMETLLRVEHKLDLVLKRYPVDDEDFVKVGAVNHSCPVCAHPVTYNVDVNESVVVRKCGCSTGKIALDLKAFAPPVSPARKNDNGGRDEQEDGNDPNGSNRRSQWR